MRKYFYFEKDWININHGAFGTYPRPVGRALQAFQVASETRPDEFIRTAYPALLDRSRALLANYLNVPLPELVFVPNTTTGINTVLRSLVFKPGDSIAYFDFIYNACKNSVVYIEETTPAVGIKVPIKFPASDDVIVDTFRAAIKKEQESGGVVKVAIFDTVVSIPGLRLPFERLVGVCKELGVLSLIDGAHGVGHLRLDLGKLDADFFVSNCHKWLYVPRGCAVFHVPLRNQHLIRSTLPTSHGYLPPTQATRTYSVLHANPANSDFVTMFEFVGTVDTSPVLCIPAALRFREVVCGGEDRIMAYAQDIGHRGAQLIAQRLGTEVMERDRESCLWNVRLPLVISGARAAREGEAVVEEGAVARVGEWAMRVFNGEFNTAIPLLVHDGECWARVSGQVYLEMSDFEVVAGVLENVCKRIAEREYL
ncbi:pyridoxal phosphate-dependent transferase [Morchella snyderi]|nr:pyridoxal phosphate-dependent transferase [Morchella snyderi]